MATRKKTRSASASTANDDIDEVELDDLKGAIESEVFEDPNPVTAEEVIASGAVAELSPEQRHLRAVQYVKENMPLDASPEAQEQVARLLNLMEYLQLGVEAHSRLAVAELALQRLIEAPQDITLATRVIDDLHRKLGGRIQIWFFRLRIGTPPHIDVVIGLLLATLLLGVLIWWTGVGPLETLGQVEPGKEGFDALQFFRHLIWLGAIGAMGSAVSIFVRLNEFVSPVQTNAYFHFLTGLFKPLIGFAAADLAYVLIKSQIVPLDFRDYSAYAFVGIAFAAGFSERMVTDLVGIVERQVSIAGERGIEAQRAAAAAASAELSEVEESLSGSTIIGVESVYEDVDLDELEEEVLGVRKNHPDDPGNGEDESTERG